MAAGWLGLQQPQSTPARAAAAEGEDCEPAQMEHSQGLLEVLSALGGTAASPAAAKQGSGAPAALPQMEWTEHGKLVQQLVLVLLQILTIHPEVGAQIESAAVCAINTWACNAQFVL